MKKMICLSLLLSSVFGFSQIRERGTIELSSFIGYATSNYYSNKEISNRSTSTADFGINVDYYFNNRWSLRSALLFQSMGSEYGIATFIIEEKLNYLTIPLNANWHFGSTRKWYLNFGPSFSFLTSAEANNIDIKSSIEPFQLGLSYGIGYKLEITEKFSFLIDLQAVIGLTEVAKSSDDVIKNQYGSMNIGGVFKL